MADNETSRSFFSGNYGDNYNPYTSGFYDRDKQTQEAIRLSNESTLKKYQEMYKLIGEEHQSFLAGVSRRESATYKTLCASVLSGYKDMYDGLIANHKRYIDTVNAFSITPVSFDFDIDTTVDSYMDFYNQLETLHDIYLSDIERKETEAYQRVLNTNLKNYNETVAKMQSVVGGTEGDEGITMGVASSIVALTALIEKSFSDNFKEDLFKFINEHPVGTGEGTGGGGRRPSRVIDDKKPKVSKETLKMADKVDKISDRTVDLIRAVSDTVVVGKENQIWFKLVTEGITKTTDVVTAFMSQEKVTESLVQLVFWAINKVLDYFGKSIQEQQNTYEENFTKYAVYTDHHYNAQNSYWDSMDDTLTMLYNSGLENNVKSTEIMKKQVELMTKGMSEDISNSASLQNILLNTIAPALNTESDIIKDLQQTAKFDVIDRLAGMTEYVRDITGASRVAQGSLNTLVDKLEPIEMMAKKNMLSGRELALAEYLDKTGLMTYQQATNLLVKASDVVADPSKILESGDILQRIQVASGNYTSIEDVMIGMLNASENIMGSLNEDSLVASKLINALQAGDYYNWGSDPEAIAEGARTFFRDYSDELESKTPTSEFDKLEKLFVNDGLQTADAIQEVRRVNTEYGQKIGEKMQNIYDVLADISEYVLDVADFLLVGKNYKETMVKRQLKELDDSEYGTSKAKGLVEDYSESRAKRGIADSIKEGLKYAPSWSILTDAITTAIDTRTSIKEDGILEGLETYNEGMKTLAKDIGTGGWYSWGKSLYENFMSTTDDVSAVSSKYGKKRSSSTTASSDSDSTISWRELALQGFATGGYVEKPQVVVVAENEPEIITPERKMSDVVTSSLNDVFSKPLTIDASSLEDIIQACTERVVTAILSSGNQTIVDPSTGLMKQGTTNTKPITSLGSFMR